MFTHVTKKKTEGNCQVKVDKGVSLRRGHLKVNTLQMEAGIRERSECNVGCQKLLHSLSDLIPCPFP